MKSNPTFRSADLFSEAFSSSQLNLKFKFWSLFGRKSLVNRFQAFTLCLLVWTLCNFWKFLETLKVSNRNSYEVFHNSLLLHVKVLLLKFVLLKNFKFKKISSVTDCYSFGLSSAAFCLKSRFPKGSGGITLLSSYDPLLNLVIFVNFKIQN